MKSVLLPLVFALAGAGCVQDDLTLTIERYLFDDPEAGCVVSPTSMTFLSEGILDVGIVSTSGSPGYMAFPVVRNNLPVNQNASTSVERNAVTVTGVNVELKPDATYEGAVPTDQRKFFVQAAGGRVMPSAQIAFGVEIIPRPIALVMAGLVQTGVGNAFPVMNVAVSPVGQRSGSEIIGAAVEFPVKVCKFCLSGTIQACPSGGFPEAEVLKGGCFQAQDANVTCCVASSTQQLLCGDEVPLTQTMP
jgi:hypothetical protein